MAADCAPWRLLLTIVFGFGFIGWVLWFAGTTIGAQAEALRDVVTQQFSRLMAFVASIGLMPPGQPTDLGSQLLGSVGRLTSAVGTAIGAVASFIAMIVIGIFLAAEPRIYDRGIAWMLPLRHRAGFYRIVEHAGFTLRRLLFGRLIAMVFEGVFVWFMLTLGGVPMAGLLGLVTGVLAFIPNIGAITSGVLMIAVGFSAGYGQGIWCIIVYFLVHNIDAYVVVPYVARRTVDLAPAVLLAMQLLMAALFGILGILLADPLLATLKVVLVDLGRQHLQMRANRRKLSPADRVYWAADDSARPRTLHHCSAAADHLAHLDFESQAAALGKALRRRAISERQARRHREPVAAAVLHLGHGFGKAGEHHAHCERLRSAVILAGVEHPPVVERTGIIHERGIAWADRLTGTSLEGAELEPACGHLGPQRTRPVPGEANPGRDDDQERSHSATARPVPAGRWAASATDTVCARLGLAGRAFALGALALELAGAADRRGALTRPLFRRLLVMTAQLHLAVDALALQLFLERAQRLLNIVVANDDLHKVPSNSFKFRHLMPRYQCGGQFGPLQWQ